MKRKTLRRTPWPLAITNQISATLGAPQRSFRPASAQRPIYGARKGPRGEAVLCSRPKGLREPSTGARGERRPTTTSDDLIPSGLFNRSHEVHHQRGAR